MPSMYPAFWWATAAVLICAFEPLAAGRELIVGGDSGWTLGMTYEPIDATVGDILVFSFVIPYHDVWLLNQSSCESLEQGVNLANPVESPYRYTLEAPGELYFACSVPGHCEAGMLVSVNVEGGGSWVGEPDVSLNQRLVEENEGDYGNCTEVSRDANGVVSMSCVAGPLPLAPGEGVNTNLVLPSPFPNEVVQLLDTAVDLLDAWGESVPLSDVYIHHIFTFYGNLPFAEGAEIRGIPLISQQLPAPYARLANGADLQPRHNRFVNFHLLNTEGMEEPMQVKRCIECWCPGSNPLSGRMSCCATCNSSLAGAAPRDFYMLYNVTYRPVRLVGQDIGSLQAYEAHSGARLIPAFRYTIDLVEHVEYDVLRQGPNQSNIQELHLDFLADCTGFRRVGVVSCQAHLHIGGRCIQMLDPATNATICESCMRYGTEEGLPGDEADYVVGVTMPTNTPPYPLTVGQPVLLRAEYDASDNYLGVMALLHANVVVLEPEHSAAGGQCTDLYV